ncbi:interleukin-27 receptor subunit alpha isoform X2 [Paroedura picta]|uniref:interleukin-27 receptor subunit alpha isoform X2 n=1 Tax=Paroedura picta TaxID=143630 RepID=UPI004055DBA9
MEGQGKAFWLLALAFKALGLEEGASVASVGLQCFCGFPSHDMTCSWSAPEANATFVLAFRNLKYAPSEIHKAQAREGDRWLTVARSRLKRGEVYSVWLEIHRAAGVDVSETLNVSLEEIVKPPAPELVLVEVSSSGAVVRRDNSNWAEHIMDQRLLWEIRYKASTDAAWIWLSLEQSSQEDQELVDLVPFTLYEVQARCIQENRQGFWSEWSPPQIFRTMEAAPLGPVDVWREIRLLENLEPAVRLLWKALDPEAARGVILNYTVDFRDRHGTSVGSLACLCYSAPVPAAASYAQVSAWNSAGGMQPTPLSLEQADLPAPQEVRVQTAQGQGLRVTWTPGPSSEQVQPEEYVAEWKEEISGELLGWIRQPAGSRSALLKGNLMPEEPYLVSVSALYAHGSSSSAPVRMYTQEGVPSAGPPHVKDQSVSSTVSLISWGEIPLAHRHGRLTHHTIYLQPSAPGNRQAYKPIVIGAPRRSHALKGLKPSSTYHLWITASTSAGEGPPSLVHEFHTPGPHWQVYTAVLLSVGFLLLLALVVLLLKRRWFLNFLHKVLPLWCWQRVPDPGHSLAIIKMGSQATAPAKEAPPAPSPAEHAEEPEILNITEPAPPPAISPARLAFSGYEKRVLPSLEELERLT